MEPSYNGERRPYENFICHEAQLMDEGRYKEWLTLWDSEALYWIPANQDEIDPAREISLVYERYNKIRDRVARLESKFAHAQEPRSRLIRVVSNFLLEKVDGEAVTVSSVFSLGEIRNDVQTTYFGRNRHVLIATPAGLRMREKKVLLLNNASTMGNMSFLI
jgi:benzoate/toluate 1,2-dioxygenase subunit beta